MNSLPINFAGLFNPNHRARVSLRSAIFFIAAGASLATISWKLTSIELTRINLQIEVASSVQNGGAIRPTRDPSTLAVSSDSISAINLAIRQLNLPWSEIFTALEDTTPENIALLSLMPDAKGQTLSIVAEAKTTDEMVDYVRLLNSNRLFDTTSISKHEINEKDSNKPVRFEVLARWGSP